MQKFLNFWQAFVKVHCTYGNLAWLLELYEPLGISLTFLKRIQVATLWVRTFEKIK